MDKWLEECKKGNRMIVEAALAPIVGDRFQPTGFADLGAALYECPDGTRMLLVESAQSVANRLEKVIIGENGVDVIADLTGLPYVRSRLTGVTETVTSSLIESHRLNSPFIIGDKNFQKKLKEEMGYRKGANVDWRKVAKTLLKYDPNSLIHGIFFSNIDDGRVKVPRLLTGFIEAEGVREAYSGGVKNNTFDPSGTIQVVDSGIEKKGVYSNIPYQRVEYIARGIKAYFNLDTSMLRSYSLPDPATDLLILLSTYKIVKFLEDDLRLRTMCDLQLTGPIKVIMPDGGSLPGSNEVMIRLKQAVAECTKQGLFAQPSLTEIALVTKIVKEKAEEEETEGQ